MSRILRSVKDVVRFPAKNRVCAGTRFRHSQSFEKESGKLLVNGHRAPWTKRGARQVGELEWRQREAREKERGAHNKEKQSASGERPRSREVSLPRWGVSQETPLVVMGTRGLCATLWTYGGVGELYRRRTPFMESFRCADHRPIRIGDEREWLVAASPVMTKSRGPSWGQNNNP